MTLTIENSWHFSGGLWQDKDLLQLKQGHLSYKPQPILLSELQPDTVWTLRGPRRVGKTVTLKLLVADLIEKRGVPPRNIIWTSVETIRAMSQLEEHLDQILKNKEIEYLFIDEITSVIGWQNVIKKIRDRGRLTKCCLLLTGSSSFDLKAGSERMAGRKGVFTSTDRVLLPMSFKDFSSQFKEERPSAQDYMLSGGFPFRVNEFLKQKKLKKIFDTDFGLSIFDDVYFYEFGRRRLDRNIALEILFRISQLQTSATSYNTLAKNINSKPDTIKKYLDALGDAFLLSTIYSYDSSKSRVALKKDKKWIWVDPALSRLAKFLGQGEAPTEASLSEHLVGVHLLRQFELRLFEGLSAPRNVFTWKSASGKEVDYLVVNRSKKIVFPVEVKYQNQISDWDFQVIEKAFNKGLLVSKDTNRVRDKSEAVSLEKYLELSNFV